MKRVMTVKACLATVMALALVVGSAACGRKPSTAGTTEAKASVASIGVTNALLSMNPLLLDATETMKYAVGLSFLPLVEINSQNEFVGELAEKIETTDYQNFTVKLRAEAKWSDGQPVTAEDVEFTIVKLTSAALQNPSMAPWASLEGLDDAASHPDADTSIAGVKVIDEKTLVLTMKSTMNLNTVQNSLLRYLLPIPKHLLKDMSTEELKTTDWFNSPKAVSGPYVPTEVNTSQYVSYTANKQYWKGEPKIEKLNLRLYSDASALLPAIKTGTVDFVQQTTAQFPTDDLASLEKVENVKVVYDKPVTNQFIFLNAGNLTDVRVRQAIAMGINRPQLVESFLGGKGEVTEGFINSASLYHKDGQAVTPYDPEKAKQLVKEAGWDSSKVLSFKINSGDPGMVLAADVIVQQLEHIGIKAQVQKMDLNNLLTAAGNHDFDLFAVQYTLASVDPFADVQFLVTGENWSQYQNKKADELVQTIQGTMDDAKLRDLYAEVDALVQQEVPILNAYVSSAPGVVSNRLKNAEPHAYGSFLNIESWEIG